MVPAKTPKPVIDKLHAEVVKAAKSPEFQEKMNTAGFVLVASTPDEFNKLIKSESDRWGKLVKEANITAE